MILALKTYKVIGNIEALLFEKANNMEEKKFRSISIRDPLVKKIEEFIETCPEFIRDNPEYNSVAGFFDQAARQKLQQLKDNGIKKLPNLEGV